MGRGDWIRQNLKGLQRLLEPLAIRILEKKPDRSTVSRKALGAQMGGLLGYVSRRVLGQYDAFLPPDDEGLLYFVGPNLIEVEQRYGLPSRDFRLWVAIHEVTHRVQFASAPWLRAQLSALVGEYLDSVSLDSGELAGQLRRAVEQAAKGADIRGMQGLMLILTPEQRAIVEKTQAMMSVLEGHASYVMNEVAKDHVDDLPKLRPPRAAPRERAGTRPAEGDRLRSEGRPVRRGGAVHPRDRRARGHGRREPRLAGKPEPPLDRRGGRSRQLARPRRRLTPWRRRAARFRSRPRSPASSSASRRRRVRTTCSAPGRPCSSASQVARILSASSRRS
jgi:hypothetical protein